MGLTPKFTSKEVERFLKEKAMVIEQAIIRRLAKVGEEAVNMARTIGNYQNRTNRLRNSIGYIIVANGTITNSYFPGEGEGAQEGKRYATELSSKYNEGYALIVVAGMEYALNVESKNYDVLSRTQEVVKESFKEQMQQLLKSLERKI